MSSDTKEKAASPVESPRVDSNKGPSSNMRVVYVRVPEIIFNHAKAQSYLSGMAWPDYVAKVLEEAGPYPGPASPLKQEPAPAQ
ncbi:hypothetical protein LCGC14_2333950 [marine sediment metagenome]|uniref:Uncharacterized protein n=1 Tax=marine sediment metagenome TaxID=412755 RepID=A0A0F9ERQ3_9ZZZZ